MEPSIQILVPTDWSNTARGDFFENLVSLLLQKIRYQTIERLRVTGMEIDLLAQHRDTKERAMVECKFKRDSIESQVISKLVGNAFMRDNISKAYLFSTSNPGKDAKGLLQEFEQQDNLIRGTLRFAFYGPREITEMFLEVHGFPNIDARLEKLDRNFQRSISAATLVITPEEKCWLLEQSIEGVPQKAFALPLIVGQNTIEDFISLRKLIEDHSLWSGLTINNGPPDPPIAVIPSVVPARRESVTQIIASDKFDDYSPARPVDFVGREKLLKEIWQSIQQVGRGEAKKRVFAITGPSGFGKSSMVIKLADKSRNQRWRKSIYIYHIDSRSATSPLFVAEAIKTAFQAAIDDGFIDFANGQVSIASVEEPLSSTSVQTCLEDLYKRNRILLIFFDQFEELLVKESLFSTFELFKKVAFEVEALQANLTLGFSWRTGISLVESHPAYYMWQQLRNKRTEFKLGHFSSKEASEMITILEKNVGHKIESPLRRHLLEQAQGLPWLLKKFCVHTYRQLALGISQRQLVNSQLDAATLFEEDTRDLSSDQLACLKYIAQNSPADLMDVDDKFGSDTADVLYHSRLIVRSGYRYSVYWDIFREFLITGDVPPIPVTFLPQTQMSTVVSVLQYIAQAGPVTTEEIGNNFKYTLKHVMNILGDLTAFFLVHRTSDDEFKAVDDLFASDFDLAEYIGKQLERHLIVKELYDSIEPTEGLSIVQVEKLIAGFYSAMSANSLHSYMNRFIGWLRFAGLIEVETADQIVRPAGAGSDKGKIRIRHSKMLGGNPQFLCSSSPGRCIDLAITLCQEGSLQRQVVLGDASRNAAQDLVALNIAYWRENTLYPSKELSIVCSNGAQDQPEGAVARLVRERALDSLFLRALVECLSHYPPLEESAIAEILQGRLRRQWQPASVKRYLTAGKTWLRYFDELRKLHGQLSLFDWADE